MWNDVAPSHVIPARRRNSFRVSPDGREEISLLTALTLLAGSLGPSAVTLTLGPRDSYLPPWYLPAGVIKPNEWFVSILVWSAIILGALGLWVGLRAMADGWKPKPRKLFALGSVLSLLTKIGRAHV